MFDNATKTWYEVVVMKIEPSHIRVRWAVYPDYGEENISTHNLPTLGYCREVMLQGVDLYKNVEIVMGHPELEHYSVEDRCGGSQQVLLRDVHGNDFRIGIGEMRKRSARLLHNPEIEVLR